MTKIIYSGNIPYLVVREINTESCNPKKYDILHGSNMGLTGFDKEIRIKGRSNAINWRTS